MFRIGLQCALLHFLIIFHCPMPPFPCARPSQALGLEKFWEVVGGVVAIFEMAPLGRDEIKAWRRIHVERIAKTLSVSVLNNLFATGGFGL